MKKIIALIMLVMMVFCLCSCGEKPADTDSIKIGIICLHDENSSYDKNFLEAFSAACTAKGVEPVVKTNIPEGNECYEAASELVDAGCSLVFADSFGHEDYMIQAASEYTDVQFCHATGTRAHTENLSNYHNAFAAIYEGRYMGGIAAGLKLNEMIEAGIITADKAKCGYVGAYQYAEVISGYSSFYLGVKSVCPTATMEVIFTGSWYDETAEKEAATRLISNGCVVISGHADSMGMPTACENAGVPFVFYNGSALEACPTTYMTGCRINWQPYFEYIIDCVKNNKAIDTDWTGTFATGSVQMTEMNEALLDADDINLIDTMISVGVTVFDTYKFTVNGQQITSYLADVNSDEAYTGDTEVIINECFSESTFRSAPYFDLAIDGITIIS